ncbi:hypothetical protein H633G_11654 [Metarhizium anisopliae BRIP 53284]|nr:hypothetical protein H633G_11654 [Metarhizium anisopliae BRIP 53284]
MATSWPQEVAWPAGFGEHATQLDKYSGTPYCASNARKTNLFPMICRHWKESARATKYRMRRRSRPQNRPT